jgi:hypothetical protein
MAAKHGLTWAAIGNLGARDNMHFEWTGAKSKSQTPKTADTHGSPL